MKAKDMMAEMQSPERSHNAQLIKKWGKLLEGITNSRVRETTAKLFEAQANSLRELSEETRISNVGEYLKYIFPVLRRVWPNLIANEIVSVQPMNGPIAGVFYFELKYGTDKGSITSGENLIESFQQDYSSELIDKEVIGVGDNATQLFSSTLDYTPIKTTSDQCQLLDGATDCNGTVDGGSVRLYVNSIDSGVSGVDDGVGTISGPGVSGTIDYDTGAIAVTLSAAPATGIEVWVQYVYNTECNTTIPEVNLDIASCAIKAKTRKLKALWSTEAAQDLKAYHGLDAESELVAGMASEMALEIDREIIQEIRLKALSTNIETFNATVPTGVTQVDHYRTLITTYSKISNTIHKLGIRGPANWSVISPDVSVIVEQLGTHGDFRPIYAPSNAAALDPAEQPQNFGIYKMGTLQNKWTMYKDVKFQSNEALVGYKGADFLDAGFIYSPYIPLQITATFLDPASFCLRKAVMTRYATKMVRPELYGRIRFTNLP